MRAAILSEIEYLTSWKKSRYRMVETSTVGLLENFGKFKKVLEPGLHYFNPFTEDIKPVELRTKVMEMRNQIVYTRDNMSVDIDTSVFYRILDPYKATYIVKDVDLLVKRVEVNEKIAAYVEKMSETWGIHVEQIILKDMRLAPNLSENLSIVSKTRRAMESQLISAKADLESAKLYREASDILDLKAAVQIRFLQTLENMNNDPSKKVTVIPLRQDYIVE
ncbi:unnamed protein product [Sphagnum balticum]